MSEGVSEAPFSPRTVLAVIAVGLVAFAGFVVLSTYAPELRSGRDGRAHALSRSAAGFAGLVELARDSGLPVVVSRSPNAEGRPAGLRVVALEPSTTPQALARAVRPPNYAGAVLVILPKWELAPQRDRPDWVSRVGLTPDGRVQALLDGLLGQGAVRLQRAAGATRPDPQGPDLGRVESLQTVSGQGLRLNHGDGSGGALLAPGRRDPAVWVLVDPDLVNNQGLANAARAQWAVELLDQLRQGGPVVFDVSINGFSGSQSPLRLAFEPPFLAATLCALAAALLVGWQAGVRFGAPRRKPRELAFGKTALADNSAALLALAGREPAMAVPYADLTFQQAARAAGAPRGLDRGETLALLDRLAAKGGASVVPSALASEAAAVTDAAGLMRAARKLYDFRRGMTRERD